MYGKWTLINDTDLKNKDYFRILLNLEYYNQIRINIVIECVKTKVRQYVNCTSVNARDLHTVLGD